MIKENDQLHVESEIQADEANNIMGNEINRTATKDETITKDTETTIDDKTNSLIDVLHLQMLQLLEEHIGQQLALEAHTSRARLILARTRLQQGTLSTATASLLPTHTPYRALCRLVKQSVDWGSCLKLLRYDVDAAKGYLKPVTQIFGSLVPQSLLLASRKWERCVEQIVECINVQQELQAVMRSIEQLKWTPHRRRNV